MILTNGFLRWPVPGVSQIFLIYFCYFSNISQLFPIFHLFLVYFTVISRFSIISHLFLKCFPNIYHFPMLLLISHLRFPTISQLFPRKSPDTSATYSYLISELGQGHPLHGVTVNLSNHFACIERCNGNSTLHFLWMKNHLPSNILKRATHTKTPECSWGN